MSTSSASESYPSFPQSVSLTSSFVHISVCRMQSLISPSSSHETVQIQRVAASYTSNRGSVLCALCSVRHSLCGEISWQKEANKGAISIRNRGASAMGHLNYFLLQELLTRSLNQPNTYPRKWKSRIHPRIQLSRLRPTLALLRQSHLSLNLCQDRMLGKPSNHELQFH